MKFTQITASPSNFTTGDYLVGIKSAVLGTSSATGFDRLFTPAQIASGILNSVTLVTATISSSTINTSTISNSTLGTCTLNNCTLNTATINTATLNRVTINTATIANATINTATINNATLNTATLNTASLVSPTSSNAVLNSPTLNSPVLNTATIGTATISNSTINTATINNSTLGTATLNTPTINTATINNSTVGTATINNSAINTATILNSSINLLTTISMAQVASATFTSGIFPSGYNRLRLTFDNVCPVSTATLTCFLGMQIATNGTAFVSASYISFFQGIVGQGGYFTGSATTVFALTNNGTATTSGVGTSTLYGVNGWLEVMSPSNTVYRKSIFGELTYMGPAAAGTGSICQNIPSGFWDGSSNAISAIAIAFNTGNIATGTIRVYGVR